MSTQSAEKQNKKIEARFARERNGCVERIGLEISELKMVAEQLEKAGVDQPNATTNALKVIRRTRLGLDVIVEMLLALLDQQEL